MELPKLLAVVLFTWLGTTGAAALNETHNLEWRALSINDIPPCGVSTPDIHCVKSVTKACRLMRIPAGLPFQDRAFHWLHPERLRLSMPEYGAFADNFGLHAVQLHNGR